MRNRWTSLLVGVALSGAIHLALGDGNQGSGAPSPTNTLAIYLVVDPIPVGSIIDGTATPVGLKLANAPLVADTEFKSYDSKTHTFTVLSAIAAKITAAGHGRLQTPFVLVAGGEPIYVGILTTPLSSTSSDLAAIDIGIPRLNIGGTAHFTIDRGYPGHSGFGGGVDRRSDPRIVAAVTKLLPPK